MSLFLFGVFIPASLVACAFDMVKPEKTVVDWLVGADRVVLARPAPDNPFSYRVTQVLHGVDAGPEIPHLVDSVTRRRLAADDEAAVVFVSTETGAWRRVALHDDDWQLIVETAVANRRAWRAGMTIDRISFAEALQSSTVPGHRALVIGELDKVAYRDLQKFDLQIPTSELVAALTAREAQHYRAIYALLLGLRGDTAARAAIEGAVDQASEPWATPDNLGAFAAALIETDGADAVTQLSDLFFNDPAQPLAKVEQIVMAFSVHHALAEPNVQEEIDHSLFDLVQKRPEAGVPVARQFTLRADWSQSALIEPLVKTRTVSTMADLLTMSVYVAQARDAEAGSGPVQDDG